MKRIIGAGALAVAIAGMLVVMGTTLAPAASPAATAQVGTARDGRNAIEFVGHVEQVGLNVETYGYLTHINGLSDASLFATANPLGHNEKTARFTFHGTATVSQGVSVLAGAAAGAPASAPSVFSTDSRGNLSFYFLQPGADRTFATPATFSMGTAVAGYTIRFQDVIAALVGVDPNRGVLSGIGELCQRSAKRFALAGHTYRLGRTHLFQRFSTHGWSVRTGITPAGPTSFTNLGGNTQVFRSANC